LIELYLEVNYDFKETHFLGLGIKENVIAWKQLFDQIYKELQTQDKIEESIERLKVILEKVSCLTKE
jgi:hypothetical protein